MDTRVKQEAIMQINEEVMPELDSILQSIPEFQPFAFYDKHLDCIRVQIVDCSVTEERVNRIFTVLKPNYDDAGPQFVGFNIKGIRHLFNQIRLPLEGVIRLTDIIDGIVKNFPESTVLSVIRKVQTNDKYDDLEIQFDERMAA